MNPDYSDLLPRLTALSRDDTDNKISGTVEEGIAAIRALVADRDQRAPVPAIAALLAQEGAAMSQLEKVARAIAPETFLLPRINLNKAAYERAFQRARDAIAAMREPSQAMRRAVAADWGARTWRQYGEVIEAALTAAPLP